MTVARLSLTAAIGVLALANCGDSSEPVPWGTPHWTGSLDAGVGDARATSLPPPAPISVAGSWAMHSGDNTDFIAIQLSQSGNILTGFGCIAGLPTKEAGEDYVATQCGDIVGGRIDGRRVQLMFSVTFNQRAVVAADAFVSADGRRMGGRFGEGLSLSDAGLPSWQDAPTAWLRFNVDDAWLRSTRRWPSDLFQPPRVRTYELTLLDDVAGGAEFSRDKRYSIELDANHRNGIVGDLGSFWIDELSFASGPSGETTTITAGPVPETAPTLPVELKVWLQNTTVVQVDARTPSGAIYRFSASEVRR